MKNFISLLSVLLISTISCAKKDTSPLGCDAANCTTSTSYVDASTDVIEDVQSTDQVISGTDYEFTLLPGYSKVDAQESNSLVFSNVDKNNLVVLTKEEPFHGSSEEFALEVLRSVRDSGAHLNEIKQIEINSNKFLSVDSSKDGVRMWVLISAKNNYGLSLACGGPETDQKQVKICSDIFSSFLVN